MCRSQVDPQHSQQVWLTLLPLLSIPQLIMLKRRLFPRRRVSKDVNPERVWGYSSPRGCVVRIWSTTDVLPLMPSDKLAHLEVTGWSWWRNFRGTGLHHKGALVRHTAAHEAKRLSLVPRSHSRLCNECELNSILSVSCHMTLSVWNVMIWNRIFYLNENVKGKVPPAKGCCSFSCSLCIVFPSSSLQCLSLPHEWKRWTLMHGWNSLSSCLAFCICLNLSCSLLLIAQNLRERI